MPVKGDRTPHDTFVAAHDQAAILAFNQRFRADRDRYDLVFDCRHCVHFREDGPGSDGIPDGACSLAFPASTMLNAARRDVAITETGDLVFCKYFEVD